MDILLHYRWSKTADTTHLKRSTVMKQVEQIRGMKRVTKQNMVEDAVESASKRQDKW